MDKGGFGRKLAVGLNSAAKIVLTDDKDNMETATKLIEYIYARIIKTWKLTNPAAAKLIDVDESIWKKIKNEKYTGGLNKEQNIRILTLISIYEGLHYCFGEKLAVEWIALKNKGKEFSGKKPLDVMLDGGLKEIEMVEDLVWEMAGCGGWVTVMGDTGISIELMEYRKRMDEKVK